MAPAAVRGVWQSHGRGFTIHTWQCLRLVVYSVLLIGHPMCSQLKCQL